MASTHLLNSVFVVTISWIWLSWVHTSYLTLFLHPRIEAWKFYTQKCVNLRQKWPRDKIAKITNFVTFLSRLFKSTLKTLQSLWQRLPKSPPKEGSLKAGSPKALWNLSKISLKTLWKQDLRKQTDFCWMPPESKLTFFNVFWWLLLKALWKHKFWQF